MKVLILTVALIATTLLPASFPCDLHVGRTFYKFSSSFEGGRCWDLYQHDSPAHRVKVAC